MPNAITTLPSIQLTVMVQPMAAVAWVPRCPTIAVSTWLTSVESVCSSMVGQARWAISLR